MIFEASFRGLFNFIFWFFAISFILRLIARLAAPYLVRKAQDHMRDQMNRQGHQANQRQRPEGEIIIEKKSPPTKEEYTDYIEIKD